MFKWLKPYIEAGIRPEMSVDVQRKIRLGNGMALIFALASVRMTLTGDSVVTAFHVSVIFMFLITPVFSMRGWYNFTRVWLSFWMTFIIWAVHSFAAKTPDDFVSINGYVLLACCTCLPFIFFDFSERQYMPVVFLPIVAGFATKTWFTGMAYPAVSENFYQVINRWEEIRNTAISLAFVLSLSFGYLQSINAKGRVEISKLIAEIEIQKKLLADKEAALLQQQEEIKSVDEANQLAFAEIEKQNQELEKAKKELERVGMELTMRRKEMDETQRLEQHLNDFNAVIRDNFLKSPAVFYDQNLRKLVEFLDAAQGVMFVTVKDNDGVKLKAVAAYAYHADVKMIKTIAPGDGLVGQAYKSARTFYFDRMPVNTFEIKSAFAAVQPFATVVQPLIDNVQVRGVIQLALTRPLEDWERAFLDKYSGQLAAAIAGVQTRILERAA